MEYREIKKLGIHPSLLGFGGMRFPKRPDGSIDTVTAENMLDLAYSRGVNYYDTAYLYHNGESEGVLSRVLSKYPRESYYLVTKLPTTKIDTLEDAKCIYADQKTRIKQSYLDSYLLHNLNAKRWRKMLKLGVVDWCLERQKAGDFHNFGFSFHGSYDDFQEILTARKWDCCQIQLNYMDTEEQSGMRGYQLTEELGVPLIIMEPVKGGALANPPEDIVQLFKNMNSSASPASWALRWAASLPNVMTVLSGMSALDQVKDNLATFDDFKPLNKEEEEVLLNAAATFRKRIRNGCTGCQYCMPCPSGVNIPLNFKLWNEWAMYGESGLAAGQWKKIAEEHRAEQCVSCGACEEQCPQKLEIRKDLIRAREEMDAI